MGNYKINGSETSMSPWSIMWQPIHLGVDHEGKALLAANWDVVMQFESASIALAQQWLAQASGGASVNLTTLDRWQLGFGILSSVHLDLRQPPAITHENAGPFTILVRGATASAFEIEH